MMGSKPEMMYLPAARMREPLTAYPAVPATPEDARRLVAVVSAGRTIMATIKCNRRRFFSSDFIAKVVNDSDEELSCSVTGWTHRGSTALEPNAFWIKAQTVAQIPIHAPLRLHNRLRSIALHVQNASVRATAEANVPTPPAVRIAKTLCSFGAAALAGALAWHAAMPSIQAYTIPSQVSAGDRLTASYAYSGIGTAEYQVSEDGNEVAGGVLSTRRGTFSFPTSKRAGIYHVTLSVVGPFTTARRRLSSQAVALTVHAGLAIAALQPDPSVVRSGEKISVRYVSNASHGKVTLFDASGIALQHSRYDARGLSTLRAPSVDVPTQYRVELDVTRGTSTAQASAGLLVMPSPDDPNAGPPPAGMLSIAELFRVAPVVWSASTFSVRIFRHPAHLRLTLEDDAGKPLETQRVGDGQSLVYFDAPNVSRDSDELIEASFSRGQADQVLLQHVRVRVR